MQPLYSSFMLLSVSVVTVRYQKPDGRFGTTSFNHASLADGQEHHVMLHASGLQGGPGRVHIYVDCRLAHTLDGLPAAFGSLPPGPNKVALRTLQSSGQVSKTFVNALMICCMETRTGNSQDLKM